MLYMYVGYVPRILNVANWEELRGWWLHALLLFYQYTFSNL